MSNWTENDRFAHMSWCLKHDIKIYYLPITMSKGHIVIEDKGKKFTSVEEYRSDNKPWRGKLMHKDIWAERVFELYTIKYLEYNEQTK